MTVALDSWAVLGWLKGTQPVMASVDEILWTDDRPVMSWVNLAEVRYKISRQHGIARADDVTQELEEAVRAELPTRALVLAAADLKADHPIALADCFAIATPTQFGLELWTGDPEIIDRRAALPCSVRDVR